jgi:hypothetical protein
MAQEVGQIQAAMIERRLSALEAEAAASKPGRIRSQLDQRIDLARELLEIAKHQYSLSGMSDALDNGEKEPLLRDGLSGKISVVSGLDGGGV